MLTIENIRQSQRDAIAYAQKQAERKRDETHRLALEAEAYLADALRLFNETGVIITSTIEHIRFTGLMGDLEPKLIELATQMRLPIITARKQHYSGYAGRSYGYTSFDYRTLTIPNVKRLNLLAAGLNVVAPKLESMADIPEHPVVAHHTPKKWIFEFSDTPEGNELFKGWLHQCRNDRVFKVALRRT